MENNKSASVARKSSSRVMRQYRALNYAYRRAYIEGVHASLPASGRVQYRLIKHRGCDSQSLSVVWRAVGDAISSAMLKVR